MHYLNKIQDLNINLSDPTAKSKWNKLIFQLREDKKHLHTTYPDNSYLDGIYGIVRAEETQEHTKRKLAKMGRELEGLVTVIKNQDPAIKKTVYNYIETAEKSNDTCAIDIALQIGEIFLTKPSK